MSLADWAVISKVSSKTARICNNKKKFEKKTAEKQKYNF